MSGFLTLRYGYQPLCELKKAPFSFYIHINIPVKKKTGSKQTQRKASEEQKEVDICKNSEQRLLPYTT
jgi:hypothetical protein